MALKFFALATLITIFRGEVVSATSALPVPVLAHVSDATYDPLPQYYFGYNVEDSLTADSKSQIESRNGDLVLGQYSLNDPDGTRRIVDYSSDSLNGFNAVVRKVPQALVTPVVARVAAAPVVESAVAKTVAARTEPPSAKNKSAPLTKVAPTPAEPAAKAASIVVVSEAKRSESVVAKSSSDVSVEAPAVVNPPTVLAPASYKAQVIAYSGFVAPLAVALW